MSKESFNWDASYVDVLQLADLIRQPVHFITPDGTVQFVNRAWENTYKLSR